jgi:hypothetical protein
MENVLEDWQWLHQRGATADLALEKAQDKRLVLTVPADGINNMAILGRRKPLPITPWRATARVQMYSRHFGNYNIGGLGLYESSTGRFILFGIYWYSYSVNILSSMRIGLGVWPYADCKAGPDTTYASTDDYGGFDKYLRIEDNGQDLIFSYSLDGSYYFELLRHPRLQWLTAPDQIAVMAQPNSMTNGPIALVCSALQVDTI